ncbi:hypothetical protein AYO40_03500 [Planctomycetaceae bacterium SCGC AG-212-D15]|nr:hypothetical protein AYO40_03500 [Planctomycetaceae bacterium SCGC AG-212-D15]
MIFTRSDLNELLDGAAMPNPTGIRTAPDGHLDALIAALEVDVRVNGWRKLKEWAMTGRWPYGSSTGAWLISPPDGYCPPNRVERDVFEKLDGCEAKDEFFADYHSIAEALASLARAFSDLD